MQKYPEGSQSFEPKAIEFNAIFIKKRDFQWQKRYLNLIPIGYLDPSVFSGFLGIN